MIGTLGYRQALYADTLTGIVHHGEHIFQALVRFTDQITQRTFKFHHTSRAAVDTQFVLQRQRAGGVPFGGRLAVVVEQEFGHDKQRDTFDTGRRIRQTRQHQMNDILGHLVITPGDKDLGATDAIGVAIRYSFGFYCRQIRTGVRFGQVHGAGPLARDQFRQVGVFQLITAMVRQCFNCTLTQQWAQCKGHVGRMPDFIHRSTQYLGQSLTTKLFRRIQ